MGVSFLKDKSPNKRKWLCPSIHTHGNHRKLAAHKLKLDLNLALVTVLAARVWHFRKKWEHTPPTPAHTKIPNGHLPSGRANVLVANTV